VRLWGALVGGLLLLAASDAQAVAPIFTETPLRGTPRATRILSLLAQKPYGLDRAAATRVTSGRHYKAVVILLQFPPDPAISGDPGVLADTLAHPPAAYDSLLFGGAQPTGTLRDYYREVSRGTFDVDGVATRWYMAPHPYSYYTAGQWGLGTAPNNAQQMAFDAVQLADPDLDFRLYDNDGPDGIPNSGDDDGYLDAIFVVHAGPGGEETGAVSDDIISHKWNLPTVYTSLDGGSGIKALTYTTEPEKWAGIAPFTTSNQLISIGVFCHEFGHVLGLPDLYDTRSDPAASEGIGEWDLMGSGNYCHRVGEALSTSPAHMSAWCKQRLGWVTPQQPLTDTAAATLAPVETGGAVYRLWTDGMDTGEYFLIENRQPVGFDAGLVRRSIENDSLPSHGLLIYHVDESVADNNNPAHKLLDVVEAGGVESVSGPLGVQNLDVHRRTVSAQSACGTAASITGNRGDRYDPWPGPLLAGNFASTSCPSSASYCGDPSQVAVRNIVETGSSAPYGVAADIYVEGALVQRAAPLIDDPPSIGPPNNGNGLAEPGETIRVRIPLVNIGTAPTRSLYARVSCLDSYTTLVSSDSIGYGSIAAGAADSGTTFSVTINPAPDPRGALLGFSVYSPAGLIRPDSLEILVGANQGICDDVEGTTRRWVSAPVGCVGPDQWHRGLDATKNHTPGGSWSWNLGAGGPFYGYVDGQDARLISQPIRLAGVGDTLSFWQEFSTGGLDGLSVEISTDAGASWTIIPPVGGYPVGDRWSGAQLSFAQARVPLSGYSGVVQIAFRFRSMLSSTGTGWWIDDVFVTGTTDCTTTGVAVTRFTAAPTPAGVLLEWDLIDGAFGTLGIDRADEGFARARIATLPGGSRSGSYEDRGVSPGRSYRYWLTAAREGEAAAEAGPILVEVPAESTAPKALALGRVRPNPFNPVAAIPVSLDRDGRFVLRVYRVNGTLVRTIHDGYGAAGTYRFAWDGTDDRGARVGTGIYLFELRSESRIRVEKAILLR